MGYFPSTLHKTTYRLRHTEKDRSDGAGAHEVEKEEDSKEDKSMPYVEVLEMRNGKNMENRQKNMKYNTRQNRRGIFKCFDTLTPESLSIHTHTHTHTLNT